jgi:hypothetical protein
MKQTLYYVWLWLMVLARATRVLAVSLAALVARRTTSRALLLAAATPLP